jgi:hypothetical protein
MEDDKTFEPGDRVIAIADVAHIEAGDKFRVNEVTDNGLHFSLKGELGMWSSDNFSLYQKAGRDPLPIMPDTSSQPEAKSVTISIDHVMKSAPTKGETFVNLQLSSNGARQVLVNQIAYFSGLHEGVNLMVDLDHVATIGAFPTEKIMFSYTPSERLTNIIMDSEVFGYFVDKTGSLMGGVAEAVQQADIMHTNWERMGKDTSLMAFVPDLSDEVE